MSNLGPQKPKDTYQGLLQIPGGVTSTPIPVQDGRGVNTALSLSIDGIQINGSIEFTTPVPIVSGGTGANNAGGARTNLGLGSAATLNVGTATNNVLQLGSDSYPSGGTTGQVLGKASDNDYDAAWITVSGGGGGSGTVTSVNASGGTSGFSFSGGPITGSGTLTLSGTLALASGGTGATTAAQAKINLGLATVASTGAYGDLSGKPALAAVATSGAYSDLSGTPTLATVATTGSYNDLINKPTIGNGSVTSVALSGGSTGLTTSGGPIITSGTITLAGTLAVANGGTGATNATNARSNLGLGVASVFNVGNETNQIPLLGGLVYPNVGLTGQILAKDNDDVDDFTQNWITLGTAAFATLGLATGNLAVLGSVMLPSGGTTGQVLGKTDATDYNCQWITVSGGGGGGGTVTSVALSGGTTGLTTSGGPIVGSGTITLAGTLALANGGTGATTASAARTNLGLATVAATGAYADLSGTPALGTAAALNTGVATGNIPLLGGTMLPNGGTTGQVLSKINATDYNCQWTTVTPGSGTVTSVSLSGGTTGLTTSGGPITGSGTITLAGTLSVSNGGTGATTSSQARTNLGLGTAAVVNTGVATGNVPLLGGTMAPSGGTAGQVLTKINSTDYNCQWTTVSSGSGSVTSVGLSGGTTGLTVTGSPITTSGTITLAGTLAIANGGTGATSASAALTALGAQSSSYLPPFTSATTQTVTGKLNRFVTFEDFGAVGNGTTNDTLSIQAAFNYLKANSSIFGLGIWARDGAIYGVTNINVPNTTDDNESNMVFCNGTCTFKRLSGGTTTYMFASERWLTANANNTFPNSPVIWQNIVFDADNKCNYAFINKSYRSVFDTCSFNNATADGCLFTRKNQNNTLGTTTYLSDNKWLDCDGIGNSGYWLRTQGTPTDDTDAPSDGWIINCQPDGAGGQGCIYLADAGAWILYGNHTFADGTQSSVAEINIAKLSRPGSIANNIFEGKVLIGNIASENSMIGPGNSFWDDVQINFSADSSDEIVTVRGNFFAENPVTSNEAQLIQGSNRPTKTIISDNTFINATPHAFASGVTLGKFQIINCISADDASRAFFDMPMLLYTVYSNGLYFSNSGYGDLVRQSGDNQSFIGVDDSRAYVGTYQDIPLEIQQNSTALITLLAGGSSHFVQFNNIKSFANDAAAAAGGCPIGGLYQTVGAVKVRLT